MITSKPFPPDWTEVGSALRGVSRNTRLRAYLTPVSLNGRQYYFGPFDSRNEAGAAHDQLLHYFLPFTCPHPKLNCVAENFFNFDDKEIEERYGADRLVRLKNLLSRELLSIGINIFTQRDAREKFIRDNLSFRSQQDRLKGILSTARRNALKALERSAMQLVVSHELTENLSALNLLPTLQITKEVYAEAETVKACYDRLKSSLAHLIELSKSAIDIDPSTTTP